MKYIYQIKVRSGSIVAVMAKDGTNHFVSPVTNKCNKIYLVGKNKLIHYIGITKQSISARLRYGVKPNHRAGYHGYKWLKENGNHSLVIWTFNKDVKIEAIEAELVYYFRKQYDKWPKYQTEIHFHQSNEDEKALAKTILIETQNIMRNFL